MTVDVLVDLKVEDGPDGPTVTKVMKKLTFEDGRLVEIGQAYEGDIEGFRAFLERRGDQGMKWS